MLPVGHGVSDGRHLASSSAMYHDVRPVMCFAHDSSELPVHDREGAPRVPNSLIEDHHVTRVTSKPHFSPRPSTSGMSVYESLYECHSVIWM